MRSMYFHSRETCLLRQAGSLDKLANDILDHLIRHLLRLTEQTRQLAHIQWNLRNHKHTETPLPHATHSTRGVRLQPQVRAHLPPRMIDLHPSLSAMSLRDLRPFPESRQVGILIQRDIPRSCHGRTIDHNVSGDDGSGSSSSPDVIKLDELFARGRVDNVGDVFLHSGFGYPVGNTRAVGQNERAEDLAFGHGRVCWLMPGGVSASIDKLIFVDSCEERRVVLYPA